MGAIFERFMATINTSIGYIYIMFILYKDMLNIMFLSHERGEWCQIDKKTTKNNNG